MNVLQLPTTTDVLLLYPGRSLMDQVSVWAARHPERQMDMSLERSLPEIRKVLGHVGAAIVDATEDPAQATDALLQAVARLGSAAVAMYTETMHEDLELFVRMRGSLFLLGPLCDEQWEDLFEQLMRVHAASPVSRAAMAQRLGALHLMRHRSKQRQQFINRFGAALDWPYGDVG
jgi:hypothetical protein